MRGLVRLNECASFILPNAAADSLFPVFSVTKAITALTVHELLGRGAKVGVVNAGGATSLMVASQGGHRDIVHALLLHGALAYA